MTKSGLAAFDTTLQTTNAWLHELMEELCWEDRQRAYHALRAVLHELRDRLTVGEVAALGAQLPLLLRGVYYDGWHPADKPHKKHRKGEFLAHLAEAEGLGSPVDPEEVARAAFRVVARHVTAGEIEDVKHLLPEEIRTLWPA
jgi:uncharacterized protein (DUF2267 family)